MRIIIATFHRGPVSTGNAETRRFVRCGSTVVVEGIVIHNIRIAVGIGNNAVPTIGIDIRHGIRRLCLRLLTSSSTGHIRKASLSNRTLDIRP